MKIGPLYKRATDPEHRHGARKALLVGINYNTQASRRDTDSQTLGKCHRDALAVRDLLIDSYGYKTSDIVVMLDAKDYPQPTHDNMILAIENLVKGARPGDRLVFMFAGHCCQIPCHHHSEADDFDEALMPMDHEGTRNKSKLIIDNLRQLLVNPLSPGVRLTAIFDACHSGTLLDLDHYMCNMLYTPRISRGPRGSGSRRQAVQRKTAMLPLVHDQPMSKPRRRSTAPPRMLSIDGIYHVFRDAMPQIDRRPTFLSQSEQSVVSEAESIEEASGPAEPRKGPVLARATRTFVRPWKEAFALIIRRHQSPTPVSSVRCDGWCVPTSAASKTAPRVISIAACGDPQQTWEDPKGRSMSLTLVEELRHNRHPMLKDLVARLMHSRDNVSMQLHAAAKRQRKKGHKSAYVLDGVNFQDVQVSTLEGANDPH
ncbi:caspase domain-containing protein [Fomitopsis serialis]|uniref:caspase domain-containing protein n=1 Tax=Fomitopsis serialis TaxID=139415 RepID=UPI0020085590|nr:caspase domain-containing protein [Neoantrodia serialis]KAH9916023.1 caspase domain-containing protein [Neoantrodia serialis]